VPKLWDETITTHRRAVRDAILDTAWALVAENGPLSVTMTQIAKQTGIGRATLYKYFPNVEAILLAYHERRVTEHLEQLTALRDGPGSPRDRLEAVLHEFARICYHRSRHGSDELSRLVHRGEDTIKAHHRVRDLVTGLLVECGPEGGLRTDVESQALADYCVHALSAAAEAPSEETVEWLVGVTLDGLRPRAD
jgi:AcrR family transcriptional regulator